MSALAAPPSKKRRKSILKKTQKTPHEEERPSHSIVINNWGLKERFEDSGAGTCTNYGTCTEDENQLHEARAPVRNASNRTPREHIPRASFRQHVLIRQSSAKDEQGDTIQGTATYTDQEHCPISKNLFFDKLVDKIYGEKDVDEDFVRERLEEACAEGVSVLECAIWIKSYLEQKIIYLDENPTLKDGIGQSKLAYQHQYIINRMLELIENIIADEAELIALEAEEDAEEEPIVDHAAAAAAGKRRRDRNDDSEKLIF